MSKPVWLISYESKNITDAIASMVTSITYTDYMHGKSDEIEITVEDGDRRWRELWYPSEGDSIDLKIGYVGEALLPCGSFSIDEVELGHSARTATIRGLAVPISTPMRTTSTRAYDDTTLADVVQGVAARYNLTVVGTIAEIPFRRLTQAQETDLAFLKRLAEQYGYAFSIRGTQLVFYPLLDLEAVAPEITLYSSDLLPGTTWSSSAQSTYTACEISYLDPETGEAILVRVEADGIRRGATNPQSTSQTSAAPATAPDVVLRQGSPHKDEVRDWQRFLQGRSQYSGAIDGLFGALTERGTRAFQSASGLSVDGVVGPLTYAAAIDAGFGGTTESAGGTSAVGDVLRLNERVESAAEAEARASAALHRANRLRATGSLYVIGNQNLVAGTTINIPDAGRLAGAYMVDKSVHKLTRGGGYKTDFEVAHVS